MLELPKNNRIFKLVLMTETLILQSLLPS
ncbi:unnamed protein product, partial [Vitis vinifera]